MSDDSFFRWILLGGLVTALPIGIYHRFRAHTGEPLSRREEGVFLPLRLMGVIMFASLVAYMIHPGWMAWSSVPLPNWARWCGVVLGAANIPFLWWVFHSLGKNITDTVVTRIEHTLVVTGPYRWVRHPFYVAMIVGVASAALITANWFFALAGSVAFALLAIRSRIEEAKLIERFGDNYRAYQRRTGRFVPRLFRRRD